MGIQRHLTFLGLVLLVLAYDPLCINAEAFPQTYRLHQIKPTTEPLSPSYHLNLLNRSNFPKDFVFGAASASYQVEGAWNVGGKGPSIWDHFTHTFPEKVLDRSNGDVATDSYHRYKEDVAIIKQMGLTSYRFSISWSRVLPRGKLSGGVNEKGISYYNKLINELLANGITPSVTLFHWDLPQALEDEYKGFLSPKIVNDYLDYADLCFKRFGDRVKNWVTINEPTSYSTNGYNTGLFPPGRCSAFINPSCTGGNSGTEPYIVTHYQLLSHAAAVKLYRQKYQAKQKGIIGITVVSTWTQPLTNSTLDHRASVRALDFLLGWIMNPISTGDYPITMKSIVRDRLPQFTRKESKMLKGSFDFLGLNYYTTFYVSHLPESDTLSYSSDNRASFSAFRNGVVIGEQGGSTWLHSYPRGLFNLLSYIRRKYNNPRIHITENGIDEVNNSTLTLQESLVDNFRIRYHQSHLSYVHRAIESGVNVMAYYAWSIMDNFEWTAGYTSRFGLIYVDFEHGLRRYPKLSAKWFKNFLQA